MSLHYLVKYESQKNIHTWWIWTALCKQFSTVNLLNKNCISSIRQVRLLATPDQCSQVCAYIVHSCCRQYSTKQFWHLYSCPPNNNHHWSDICLLRVKAHLFPEQVLAIKGRANFTGQVRCASRHSIYTLGWSGELLHSLLHCLRRRLSDRHRHPVRDE